MTEHPIDEIEPPRPCEHCGGGPDTLIVVEKVVTYEFHNAGCPVIAGDRDHHRRDPGHDQRDRDAGR
jgi:hypothetical protein